MTRSQSGARHKGGGGTPLVPRASWRKISGREERSVRCARTIGGGGFGPKWYFIRRRRKEEATVWRIAALYLVRPVRLIEGPREHFIAKTQEVISTGTPRSPSISMANTGVRGWMNTRPGATRRAGLPTAMARSRRFLWIMSCRPIVMDVKVGYKQGTVTPVRGAASRNASL